MTEISFEKLKQKSTPKFVSTSDTVMGVTGNIARGGIPFMPEVVGSASAALAMPFSDQPYNALRQQATQDIRDQTMQFSDRNPFTAGGLNMLGGIASGTAVGGVAAKGLTNVPQVGNKIAAFMQANPYKTGMAIPAASGALYGAGESPENRTMGATTGAGIAAVLGAGGVRLANTDIAQNFLSKVTKKPTLRTETGAPVVEKVSQSSDVVNQLAQDALPNNSFSPAMDESGTIRMTAGERTQMPTLQNLENMAETGVYGDQPQLRMSNVRAGQTQDVMQNLGKTTKGELTGSTVETIESGLNKIQVLRDEAKKGINEAYQVAKDKNAFFDPVMVANPIAKAWKKSVEGIVNPDLPSAPMVKQFIDEIKSKSDSTTYIKLADLEEIRSRLTNTANAYETSMVGSEKAQGMALRSMVKAYDNFMTDAAKVGLANGDDGAIEAYKAAVGKRAAFGKQFESNEIVNDILTGISGEGVNAVRYTPEQAVNMLIGSGKLSGKANAAIPVQALLKAAGEQAPQVADDLRAGVLQRILSRSKGGFQAGTDTQMLSMAAFETELGDFLDKNNSLAKVLFDEDQLKLLRQLRGDAQKIKKAQPGTRNPSGTAKRSLDIAALSGLVKITGNIPIVGNTLGRGIEKVAQGAENFQANQALDKVLTEFEGALKEYRPSSALMGSGAATGLQKSYSNKPSEAEKAPFNYEVIK
jgi:hypothetical protein